MSDAGFLGLEFRQEHEMVRPWQLVNRWLANCRVGPGLAYRLVYKATHWWTKAQEACAIEAAKRYLPVAPWYVPSTQQFLGWPVRRVRRWCRRNGIGRGSNGERIEITYAQLMEKAPDVYYALLSVGAMRLKGSEGDE